MYQGGYRERKNGYRTGSEIYPVPFLMPFKAPGLAYQAIKKKIGQQSFYSCNARAPGLSKLRYNKPVGFVFILKYINTFGICHSQPQKKYP
jgi:hypothetical protein